MRCRQCQSENQADSRFCDRCGSALSLMCAGCGASARAGAKFCSQCGEKLGGEPSRPAADAASRSALSRHIEHGERKQVSVLFADIRGSTALIDALDPELAMGLLDPAISAMVGAVQRFGGTVNRIQGDGIMALFGAPMAAEDHAVRACLAAQSILVAVAATHGELEVRVGLNSGEVVIRSVGQDPSDYDAVGVTAHLAHRLEQLATPGTVCLSGRTALLAHGAVDVESLGRRAISGIAEPIEMFRLISAYERPAWEVRAAAGAMTRFVGRESEMRMLEASLGRAGLGRGQVVTLTADAGLGKSRLAHEFIKRLTAGSWSVVNAAAMGHGQGTPYRLAADILRALLGVDRLDSRAEIARKLAQALSLLELDDISEAAPLESLLDLPVADPAWADLAPDMRRERMLPALRLIVLRRSAIRPVLLLVEDLHWADPQSEALLEALVDGLGAARVMLLVTMRPGRQPGWTARGNRSYCAGLHLGPLAPDAAGLLLTELLGSSAELAELRARIVAQSDGTPLFIEELARALVEQGVVIHEPPAIRLTRKAVDVQIPASVQAVLSFRMDQLQPDRRRLLQVAAVIGKDVPRDILASVADLSEPAFAACLVDLQAAEFLYEVNLAGGMEYTFKHALTQAVAYESMLRRERRELHARVLTAIELGASDRVAELTEILADHAVRGEVWGRAAVLACRAGLRANARSAWREAIVFLEQALASLGKLPPAEQGTREALALGIDIRLGLRVALGPLLELDRVVLLLDEASEIAARLDDPARMAAIDISRCMFEMIRGGLDRSVDAGQRALREATRLGDAGIMTNASYALAMAHWFAGNFDQSADTLHAGLELVRGPVRLRNTGTTGSVSVLYLVCLSKTYAITGDFAGAFALAAEAQAIAAETRKPYDFTYSRLAAGYAHLIAGESAAAVEHLAAALAHCQEGGVAILVPSVARYLGRAYAQTGRSAEAHALLDESLRTCRAQGMVALTVWCGLASGSAHLEAGAHDAAGSMLSRSLDMAEQHGFRPAQAQALHMLARIDHARGDTDAALASLEAAAQLAEALGMRPELADIAVTRAALRSGQALIEPEAARSSA